MIKRQSFKIFQAVVFSLVLREVRGRFSKNRLGAFWFVFEPLAHIAVLMTIYTVIKGRIIPGMDVAEFLATGIVPFLLFKNISLKGMEAVSANQGLFAYRQIKPFDCIVARAIVEFSMMTCVYVLLLFILKMWGGAEISIAHPLEWIAMMVCGIALSFGLGLIFCVIGEAMPEIKTFIRLLFLPLYFLSGIIIPIWHLQPSILKWMTWNPFLHIIDSLRAAVFEYYPENLFIIPNYAIAVSLVTLFLGVALYRARRLRLVAL